MIKALKSFFEFVKRHKIHKNESEKCINSIIECVTSSADAETHDDMLLEFYQSLIAGVEDIGGNDVRREMGSRCLTCHEARLCDTGGDRLVCATLGLMTLRELHSE